VTIENINVAVAVVFSWCVFATIVKDQWSQSMTVRIVVCPITE